MRIEGRNQKQITYPTEQATHWLGRAWSWIKRHAIELTLAIAVLAISSFAISAKLHPHSKQQLAPALPKLEEKSKRAHLQHLTKARPKPTNRRPPNRGMAVANRVSGAPACPSCATYVAQLGSKIEA